ncbi:hypothetical protein DL89DRAFT_264373 [Linderina pennispora]|uniref:Glutamyl-tRNA(Gln) amidotransferase subunit F, mitochondrial n=1 Tax=Linderina pennispora TaxID=61395 RepID=A0A1Y1WLT2_9FUNG|nr:uncharacterized protein DL89DRAFT_264373 [Linderina pennispora]ORX74519.1 hypothetical protein DL89DRAFT_264373 [Linderina pennispora]
MLRSRLFSSTQPFARAYSSFPLSRPSWSVGTLLEKPTNAAGHEGASDDPLDAKGIQHLYNLAGLRMPDPTQKAAEFGRLSKDAHQLRDFLSHIQAAARTEDLSGVEPLVRIAEPIEFSVDSPDAGLDHSSKPSDRLGRKVLQTASRSSGDYLIVEE